MVEEAKQRVSVEGAEESTRKVGLLSRAWTKFRDGIRGSTKETRENSQAGEQNARTTSKMTGALSGLSGQLKSLLIGTVSISALTQAIRTNSEALKENAELTNKLKEAQLDLQFLSQDLNLRELAAVKAASEIRGGEGAQIAFSAAFAELKSKTSDLDDSDRIKLFEQLVETSLTTSSDPLSLVPLFAKGSQFVSDPERLQNIIRKTQELSPAASPEVLGKLLPRVLGVGDAAGLAPEQTAGLAVTALKADEELGITSLRNILLALQGKGTPEGAKLLQSLGATSDIGVIGQLEKLSSAGLGLTQIENLVGKENTTVFEFLLSRPNLIKSNVNEIVGVNAGGVDLTRQAISNIFGEDEQQSLRLQLRQSQARIENIKSNDVGSQRINLARSIFEELQTLQISTGESSPFQRAILLQAFDILSGTGRLNNLGTEQGFGSVNRAFNDFFESGPITDVNIIGQQYNAADPTRRPSTRGALP